MRSIVIGGIAPNRLAAVAMIAAPVGVGELCLGIVAAVDGYAAEQLGRRGSRYAEPTVREPDFASSTLIGENDRPPRGRRHAWVVLSRSVGIWMRSGALDTARGP
jgi:hypothetical protein